MEKDRFDGKKLLLSEAEWEKRLTPEQFRILRHQGTEPSFCQSYFKIPKEKGYFECAGCGLPLFSSETKYDSGTGWPSFFAPLYPENVTYREDRSLFEPRVEVVCSRCEGHLGHVFPDGPPPTGHRFCLNAAALKFTQTF